MPDIVEQLHQEGYAVVRGFLGTDDVTRGGANATYRNRNLLFEVLDDPRARRREHEAA